MTRRICPICDHVMKSRHYCRFCKAFVAHPNIINATYRLNESSPESGLRDAETPKRPSVQTNMSVTDRRRSGAANTPAGKYSIPPRPQKKAYPAAGKAGGSGSAAQGTVVIVIAAIFLCMLLMGFLPFFMFLF